MVRADPLLKQSSKTEPAAVIISAVFILLSQVGGCFSHVPPPRGDHAEKGLGEMAASLNRGQSAPETHSSSPPLLVGTPSEVEAAVEVRMPEELQAQLKEKNPLLRAEVTTEVSGGKIIAVAINDENLRDISPLVGLPLRFLDLAGSGVEDLHPLRGMPLEVLYLERTRVKDLRPLEGMSLVELRLNETAVEDIRPLAGMPLRRLYLARTRVRDLSPLAGCFTLDSLWLNDTPVEDIRPLAGCPNLVSLTLAGTRVGDLSPLKGLRLERLHIARTPVEDLRPLAWLRLTRLVFSPGRIKVGMDVVRHMPTLREIGTAFGEEDRGLPSNLMPPQIFWQEFDAGRIPPE